MEWSLLMRKHATFTEFWPYYLQEHRRASTRGWHYVGTILAILTLLGIVILQKWVFLPLPIFCGCLLYTSPSPRDQRGSRMPSSA